MGPVLRVVGGALDVAACVGLGAGEDALAGGEAYHGAVVLEEGAVVVVLLLLLLLFLLFRTATAVIISLLINDLYPITITITVANRTTLAASQRCACRRIGRWPPATDVVRPASRW